MLKIVLAVVFSLMVAEAAFAGYPSTDPCASQAVSEACPDRSFGWQERERGGLAPEAGDGGAGSGAGAGSGDSGGSSGDGK